MSKLSKSPQELLDNYPELVEIAKQFINIPPNILSQGIDGAKVGIELEYMPKVVNFPNFGFKQKRFELGVDGSGDVLELRSKTENLEYDTNYMKDFLDIYYNLQTQKTVNSGSFHFHLDKDKHPKALNFAQKFPFGQNGTYFRENNRFGTIEFRSITPIYLDNSTINTRHLSSFMNGIIIASSKQNNEKVMKNSSLRLDVNTVNMNQIIFGSLMELTTDPLARLSFLLTSADKLGFASYNLSKLTRFYDSESFGKILMAAQLKQVEIKTNTVENSEYLQLCFKLSNGKIPDLTVIAPQVIEMCKDSDSDVRRLALQFLSGLPENNKVQYAPQFIEMCKDSDWRVRRLALQFLSGLYNKLDTSTKKLLQFYFSNITSLRDLAYFTNIFSRQ